MAELTSAAATSSLPRRLARLLDERARTFSLASRFLPAQQRRDVVVLYAFCRWIDDLADEPPPGLSATAARAQLLLWRQWLQGGLTSPGPAQPEGLAAVLREVIERYAVPREYLLALLDGVESDMGPVRMPDFAGLRKYSMRVAGAVGLAMCHILGATEPPALAAAGQLGVAMQITNVLRDVGADLRRGRVYLPADELAVFGYSPEALLALNPVPADDRLRRLLSFQVARARQFYDRGMDGLGLLPREVRPAITVASLAYQAILDRIEDMDYDVLRRRAVVGRLTKARLVLRAFLPWEQATPRAAADRAGTPTPLGEVLSWLG